MSGERVQMMIGALISCGIRDVVVVPASGLGPLYEYFEAQGRCIYATREEEAVAIAAGLSLGGAMPAVVVAQAGVGNALNCVFTLADAYDIYFPVLVCFRGLEDPNPVQRVSAEQTKRVLDTLGCVEISWDVSSAGSTFKQLVDERQRWIRCWL